jgi:hypothetical protein
MPVVSHHPQHRTRLLLLLLRKYENPVKRINIRGYGGNSIRIAGGAGQHHVTGVQQMFPAVGEALGPVCKENILKGTIETCD